MFRAIRQLLDSNERQLKKCYKIADQIEALEPSVAALSDAELRGKTEEFKHRLEKGETLDDLLPEAYAVVREAAKRVLGMRHFYVQLVGGIVLHNGRYRRDEDRRGENPGRHPSRLLERFDRKRGSRGDGQRLSGPPRPGMDGPSVRISRHDRRSERQRR